MADNKVQVFTEDTPPTPPKWRWLTEMVDNMADNQYLVWQADNPNELRKGKWWLKRRNTLPSVAYRVRLKTLDVQTVEIRKVKK